MLEVLEDLIRLGSHLSMLVGARKQRREVDVLFVELDRSKTPPGCKTRLETFCILDAVPGEKAVFDRCWRLAVASYVVEKALKFSEVVLVVGGAEGVGHVHVQLERDHRQMMA